MAGINLCIFAFFEVFSFSLFKVRFSVCLTKHKIIKSNNSFRQITSQSHLRAKFRQRFSQCMIVKVMQTDPVILLLFTGKRRNFVAALRNYLLEFTKSFILRRTYSKLNRNGSFHKKEFTLQYCINSITRERQFLPALKDWVSWLSEG